MIYSFLSVLLCVGYLSGQLNRKFVKHYVDITLSSLLGEILSRSQLECSTICGKNTNCMGFMRLRNGNCVMFVDVKRNPPGATPVFIEGKLKFINHSNILFFYL